MIIYKNFQLTGWEYWANLWVNKQCKFKFMETGSTEAGDPPLIYTVQMQYDDDFDHPTLGSLTPQGTAMVDFFLGRSQAKLWLWLLMYSFIQILTFKCGFGQKCIWNLRFPIGLGPVWNKTERWSTLRFKVLIKIVVLAMPNIKFVWPNFHPWSKGSSNIRTFEIFARTVEKHLV